MNKFRCKRCNAVLRTGNTENFCSPCQMSLNKAALQNNRSISNNYDDLYNLEQNNWGYNKFPWVNI